MVLFSEEALLLPLFKNKASIKHLHCQSRSLKSWTTAEKPSVTERQSVKQLKNETAPSSHYLVRIKCDECISVVKHRNVLESPVPSVGDECQVDWNGVEYTAKVLTVGCSEESQDGVAQINGLLQSI